MLLHARRRESGFSLIEIVIVVAILAVLIVTVGPDIALQLQNSQVRNAAESMQAGLQRARTEAISRNANVRFSIVSDLSGTCVLSSTAGSWIVSLDDPTGDCDNAPGVAATPRILVKHEATDGNAIATVDATQNGAATKAKSITFNSLGRPATTTELGRIVVTSLSSPLTHRSYRLEVSGAGGVRLCDPSVVQTSDDPRRCLQP